MAVGRPPGRREPKDEPRRLTVVHRLTSVLALALVVMIGASPAAGAREVEAQTGPSLEVSIGLGGFVSVGDPASVSASISSPVLIAGRLRVRGGGVAVSRPIEVPAGGEQVYHLTVPPLEDGTRLTVEVLDHDDEVVVAEIVNVRTSSEAMAVGVIGSDQLVGTLDRVRTIVTDRPVEALLVADAVIGTAFDVVDYLVIDTGGGDRLAEGLDWATSGGHLVVASDLVPGSGISVTPLPTGVDGVTAASMGAGRIVMVDDLAGRDGDEWAAILRPAGLDLANSSELGFVEQGGLLQIASESGSRQVPSLPWLLFAILGFALVIGPVNFLILSKLDKRDWAWATIPVLALVAVVGFWVAGRQRIAGTNLTHASVIVEDGALSARSAVIVAAGVAGERRVAFEPESLVYPEPNLFGGTTAELALDGGNTGVVDLGQLGFTGVGVVSDTPDVNVPSATFADGSVTVQNSTELSFWGWGLVRGGSSVIGTGELDPGSSHQVRLPAGDANLGVGFIDAIFNQLQLWDDPERNGLWSFGSVLTNATQASGTYFVGLTDDYRPDVGIDGVPADIPGMALVLVRVDGISDEAASATGTAASEVVGVGFVNWLDWGVQRVVSTDELTVGFTLPDPTVTPRFHDSQQFGMPAQRYEAWSWPAREFVEIVGGEPLGDDLKSPDGRVFVRLIGDELGDNPFSPDALTLEWDV